MRTLKYPLTLKNGTFEFSEGSRVITEKIFSVLETRPRERIERPEYGTPDYVFTELSNINILTGRIEISITEQIPEISNIQVTGTALNNGQINLKIAYTYQNVSENLSVILDG